MDERREKNRNRFADAERTAREAPGTPAPARQQGSFGTWLRAQREARGVSMDAIAEASKISRRYLEALEADRFDTLPAPVFVRGFLREYARIVGLDPDEVVNFYLLARPAPSRERGAGQIAPPLREPSSPRRASLWLGYGALIVALLALFVGIAAAISWWAGRRTVERAPSSGRDRPAAVAAPAPALPAPAVAAPPTFAAPSAGMESPAGEALRGVPLSAEVDAGLRVVLEFQQDCWVDLVVDGRRRESELKAGGETLALEANDYVLLTLGNGPAVRIEVNGEPFALPAQGSRVVRDLRIDRAVAAARQPASAEPLRR